MPHFLLPICTLLGGKISPESNILEIRRKDGIRGLWKHDSKTRKREFGDFEKWQKWREIRRNGGGRERPKKRPDWERPDSMLSRVGIKETKQKERDLVPRTANYSRFPVYFSEWCVRPGGAYAPSNKYGSMSYTRCAWAAGTFFPVVLLCQFFVLAGNRFWFYILTYVT